MLGTFADAIPAVHQRLAEGVDLEAAIEEQAWRMRDLHDGTRRFLMHALERYFEYHESREAELGPLRWITGTAAFPKGSGALLTAWGALYESASGDREIRRFRFGSAQSARSAWAYVAAHVAAEVRGRQPVRRIWVTEIGLMDGIESHILDGISRDDALKLYEQHARDHVFAAVHGLALRPGRDCSGCLITGACPQLIPLSGFLQVSGVGPWTRSVSARDLEEYERCPSRWYMEREAHLPQDSEAYESQLRGLAVHQWLHAAHARGTPCVEDDLPEPDHGLPSVEADHINAETYAMAYPYLKAHLEHCPLKDDMLSPIASEQTLYGYDAVSDVVVATKADAVFRREDTLVIREVKTTQSLNETSGDAIFTKYMAVPWGLVAEVSGMAKHFHASHGEVQLEILTPQGGYLFTYKTTDDLLVKMARGRIRRLSQLWIDDVSWNPRPHGGCTSCSVRRWCAVRDQWSTRPIPSEDASHSTTDLPGA